MGPAWLLALIFFLAPTAFAQELSISSRTETGFFNRAYQDREYISTTAVTFPVPYWSLSAEIRRRDPEGNVLGADLAQTTIAGGSVFNYDRTESQPATVLTFAGVFIGRDLGWWEADVGVGALVQLKDFPGSGYLTADGSVSPGRAGGLDWDHRESFTLITGLFRFLPESGPHLKVRLAREGLSLTENLFNAEGVWPTDLGLFSVEVSFSTPQGYWSPDQGILRSNERLGAGWSGIWGAFRAGLRAGFLLRPEVAGTGDVDLLHRLSVGLDLGFVLPSLP